MQVIGNFYFE